MWKSEEKISENQKDLGSLTSRATFFTTKQAQNQ
jgi:hypothetical protein